METRTIHSNGVTYESCSTVESSHYWHMRENIVLPWEVYNRLHPQACVLPVRPVAQCSRFHEDES
jgi:hypothetical protein